LEISKWIDEHLFTKNRKSINNRALIDSWWIKNNYIDKKYDILKYSEGISVSLLEAIYRAYHQDLSSHVCRVCSGPVKFINFKSGFQNICSKKCSYKDPIRSEKIRTNVNWTEQRIKARATNQKKYGVDYIFQIPEFQEKLQIEKMNKYGSLYVNSDKLRATNQKKYGVDYIFQIPEFQEKIRQLKYLKYKQGIITWSGTKSKDEKDLIGWLNSLSNFKFKGNRTLLGQYEIDAYCPELKLGIEYCGLYWHSERVKPNDYHYKKYQLCKNQGVRLITIFEDEWKLRTEQVKDFIKATIGLYDIRIPARKCEFKKVCKSDAISFLKDSHIQGAPHSIIDAYGLFYRNDLVGVVTYAKHHRNGNEIVLNRLSFKRGVQIIGGASKLFKNSPHQNIITWSDNRWSTGKLYEQNGFKLDGILGPDYSYVLNDNKYTRRSKQSSQKKILDIPKEISEHQWHLNQGIYRIYDCGKIRWRRNGN
jgi:very-short-patch-repair endonuclease